MKRETKYLLRKATDSLVLSIEHFNRPSDRGRVAAVLILLDHAFEMLLKAAIVHRGGKIQKPGESQTIGFDECLRKGLSDGRIKFLREEQVQQLQALNNLRDGAQHYLIDLSEQHLYIHAQAGLTLFRDILHEVFGEGLNVQLPARVLPLSTTPPTDLAAVFEQEVEEVRKLLKPRKRKRMEASAKLRGLAAVDGAVLGSGLQPTEQELRKRGDALSSNGNWHDIFPGVAAIDLTSTGTGPSIDLRITKKDGAPIQLVQEGTPDADRVAVRRVDSLGFYNLGRDQLAQHLNLTGPKTTALIWYLKIKDDPDCFREFKIGKTVFSRYSKKAFQRMRDALQTLKIDDVWADYRNRPK